MDLSDEEVDVEEVLRQAENVECVDEKSIAKIGSILRKKKKRNEQERIEYPKNPEKWVVSEVDLDEVLNTIKNLSVCTNLYKSMIECDIFEDIINLLNHPNNDIIMESIEIIKEVTEPSNVYELNREIYNLLIEYFLKKKMCHFVINALEKINEKENEESYNAVYNILSIFENIFELENKLQYDLLTNSKLLFFLLNRLGQEVKTDDSNALYVSEIIVLLILRINQFSQHVYNDFYYTITIFDYLLKYLSKYRKQDPENLNKEEILLNCFQALGYLLLSDKAKKVFESTVGLELMLRLLSERKFLCFPALKIIALLLTEKNSCNKFVELGGLKYLFCLFMLRNIPKKKVDLFELEENMITIISNLSLYCTDTFLGRVLNKFGEKKCEKIIRLLELRQKYSDIIKEEKKKKKKKKKKIRIIMYW